MKQPIKKNIKPNKPITKKKKSSTIKKRKKSHPKYGTSKLEEDFAKDFLDKLGIPYVYQFEAKDIGRFYDFYLPTYNVLIEIDGQYYHADERLYDQTKLNPMQKRNKRVDEYKNKWAMLHCIPLMRIKEYDIRNNSSLVMEELKNRLNIEQEKIILKENKKKRQKPKKDKETNNI